ncbi:fasciclin-like arabinogalactan protein 12 [Olea europaea var. sylvestris]|uniref:fasciclin-like arabinogalactan protein 12 n=1 Tax=Olea europaea var. sylvestris TaxID=158386 RepID=UPI000C1CFAA9|nr:fasciclin-like arabinogalactan protein 12 [Olea europaea var. sylvestris]
MKLFSFFLLIFVVLFSTKTLAQTLAQPPAPAGPTNITKILEKAGQFTTLIRLMKTTQVADQINTALNNSNQGLTVFAPTDNAFSSLKAGILNSLSDQEKVSLLQFHILPNFLTMSQFQTVSNPLRTQAGDSVDGEFPLNVTTSGNQVNVSSGVNDATVANTIYTDNQLAVYEVDKVLLPLKIFASPAPASAPSPSPSSPNLKKKTPVADSPVAGVDASAATGADVLAMRGILQMVAFGVAMVATLRL